MKRSALVLGSLLAATALVGSPALAAKRAVRHTVSCKQINEAIASGKSAEDVAKDLNVSSARVKSCAAPAARHHHRRAAGKSS